MKCIHCKAEMTKGVTPYHIDRKGIHISLDEVPAWVCPQCGEVYFDKSEVDSMQEIVKAVEDRAPKLVGAA